MNAVSGTGVDVHAHYYPPEYLRFLRSEGVATDVGEDPLGGPDGMDERLRMMDSTGVRLQALGVGPLFPFLPKAAAAVSAARLANQCLIDLAQGYSERIRVFAVLPLPHVDASLDEIEGSASAKGVVGWSLGPTVLGRPLTDPSFFEVFERLNEMDAVIFVHPVGTAMQFYPSEPSLTWLVGAIFEDTALAVDMAVSGWASRFPRLKIVIPHLGGALPFILQRIDDQYLRRNPGAASPRSALTSMWFDTVNSDPAALRLCLERLGSDRVVLGTDFPFLPGAMFKQAIDYVGALDESTRKAVWSDTARGLLNLGR